MPVDAIGSTVGSGAAQLQPQTLGEQDLLKIFLTQLQFQDPLEPVDSREFLAQLAQFTSVEQTAQLNENLQGLLALQSISQSVSLIGRTVQVTQDSQSVVGVVTTLQFQNGAPLMTIQRSDGSFIQGIKPSQITLVR